MFHKQYFRRKISVFSAFFFVFLSLPVFLRAQETGDEQEDPVAIFNQGQTAHEKGDLQAAINLYEKALKIIPEFPEAEYQRGVALLASGKTDEAEKAVRRAVELRADWSLATAKLGEMLVRKYNLSSFQGNSEKQGKIYDEASQVLTKAIQLDANNFPALVALVELRLNSSAPANVLRETFAQIKILTDGKMNAPASVWAARGALENRLADKAAAKTSLNRALQIDARNQIALYERAQIALTEGDANRAAEIAKTLAEIAPNSLNVKILQARIYAETGKPDEAFKILDSIKNPSNEVSALRDKILANNSSNAAELEKQLEKDAKNATILGRLCTLLRAENPVKAIDYCRRASEAEPENVNHAVGFGAALVQAKRFDEAVGLFRRLAAFAPDNFTVRANLATALFQLKKYPEAKTEYVWLTERQPNLAIAFYFLGITHDQLGEYLDAMANYQQFLRLADQTQNRIEIEKVNLRMPILQKQIDKNGKSGKNKGKKNG